MKITIEATPKEVADLILEIRDRQFDTNMKMFVRKPYSDEFVPVQDFIKVKQATENTQI